MMEALKFRTKLDEALREHVGEVCDKPKVLRDVEFSLFFNALSESISSLIAFVASGDKKAVDKMVMVLEQQVHSQAVEKTQLAEEVRTQLENLVKKIDEEENKK